MSSAILSLNRLQDLLDFGAQPGPGSDGYAVTWDNGAGEFALTELSAGVTDHGALTGLSDDDHAQYLLVDGSRAMTGQLVGVAGSASAPTFALTGYPNTGLYLSNPNNVGISAGGALALNINATQTQVAWGKDLALAGGHITITEHAAGDVPLTINLAAGQTADALQVKDSGGGDIAGLAPSGRLVTQGYYALKSDGVGTWSQVGAGCAISSWNNVLIRSTVGAAKGQVGVTGTTAYLQIGGVDRVLADATGIGFFGATPVAQPAHIADPTGGATVDAEARAAIVSILADLAALGLQAAS